MKQSDVKQVVGDTFEDLSISEMVQVQGSGDVTPETTPICYAAATIAIVKTLKGHC